MAAVLAAWMLLTACGQAHDWRLYLRSPAPDEEPAAVEEAPVDEGLVGEGLVGEGLVEQACGTEDADAEAGVIRPVAAAEPDAGPCADEASDCRDALERLRADRLAGIDLDIRVGGRPGNDYPCECRLEGETFQPRRFASTTFTWKAAGYCHKPLYFEDWELERYGHSHGMLVDPFVSAAHFFVTLPVLPYKMGLELPWECVYPLGYYRPGSCAPWTVPAVPISIRGFAVEAATITGIVFVLP